MRKLKECFRDESGVSFPLVIAVTLSLLLILCGVMEYLRLNLMAAGVKEAVQDAIVVVVNDNYANVYHGVREGYSGGYTSDGSGFEAMVMTGTFTMSWTGCWVPIQKAVPMSNMRRACWNIRSPTCR